MKKFYSFFSTRFYMYNHLPVDRGTCISPKEYILNSTIKGPILAFAFLQNLRRCLARSPREAFNITNVLTLLLPLSKVKKFVERYT